MPSSQAVTATCTLHSAVDVEQTARQVRQALGPRARFDQDASAVLVARFGSRTAYRLLGVWAKTSQVPVRVRFDLTARDQGTQVTASMTSDPGWYVMTTSLAHRDYRVRFDQLVAGLQRAGLAVTGPIHQPGGATGAVA